MKPRRTHPKEFVKLDASTLSRARTEYDSDTYWLGLGRQSYRDTLGGIIEDYDTHGFVTQRQATSVANILNYNEQLRASGKLLRPAPPAAPLVHPRPRPVAVVPRIVPTSATAESIAPEEVTMSAPVPTVVPESLSEVIDAGRSPLITLTQVSEALGFKSRSRLDRLIAAKQFLPPDIGAGTRSPRWYWDKVTAWKAEHADRLVPHRGISRGPTGYVALLERLQALEARVVQLEAGDKEDKT
jgi:predicted DNA-binding transcriptional regulator AlpA